MTISQNLSSFSTPVPNRGMSEEVFAPAADVFAAELAAFVPQMNNVISQFNADILNINALNGIAARFTFDTGTADADPGAGRLRLGNATQNAATVLRIDPVDANSVNLNALLNTFDASTTTVKGRVRLQHATDPTKFLVFNLTAKATPSGYFNFTVANVASSAASPFANNDPVVLSYVWNGDQGIQGPAWTGGTVSQRSFATPVNVAYAATLNVDTSLSNLFYIAPLTGNVTAFNLNNPADGHTLTIRFVQDATGSRTVATPTGAKISGSIDLTASKASLLTLTYVGTVNGSAVNRWEGAWVAVPV